MLKFVARIGLSAAGLVLSLAMAELALRVLGLGYGNAHMESPVLHHVHARNHSFVSYHRSGEYGGHVVHYDADQLRVAGRGVRPAETSRATRAKTVVAFMGDSFVEALQVAYEGSFVGRLEAQVGGNVRVLNFGTSSCSPLLYLIQWRRVVRHARPTHVFLMLYHNDVRDDELMTERARRDEGGRIVAVPGPAQSWLTLAARRSFLGRLLNKAWLQLSWAWEHRGETPTSLPTHFVEENPGITDPTDRYLREFVAALRNAGIEPIMTAVPSKARTIEAEFCDAGAVFNDKVRAWARANAVRFIDLAPAFYAAADRDVRVFFDRDIHFTTAGHAVAAEEIARSVPELFHTPGSAASSETLRRPSLGVGLWRNRSDGAVRSDAGHLPAAHPATGAGRSTPGRPWTAVWSRAACGCSLTKKCPRDEPISSPARLTFRKSAPSNHQGLHRRLGTVSIAERFVLESAAAGSIREPRGKSLAAVGATPGSTMDCHPRLPDAAAKHAQKS